MVDYLTTPPPQDLDAEAAVAGGVIIFSDLIDQVRPIIRTGEPFYLDANRRIWQATLSLFDRNLPIDAITVSAELKRQQYYEAVGGDSHMIRIIEAAHSTINIVGHAHIVRDKHIQRQIIQTCSETMQEAYQGCFYASELLERFEGRAGRLAEQGSGQSGRWLAEPAKVAMDRHLSDLPEGISSGFFSVDERIGGLKPGRLIILAGRPGMGKTSFAENIIEHVARHVGTVFFSSIEMGEEAVFDRLTISQLETSLGNLRRFARENIEQTQDVIHDIGSLPVYVDVAPVQSVASIAAQCRMLKRSKGLSLVVVDYLGLIEPEDRKAPKEAQIGLISQRLAQMAKALQVPVICLSQLNRECERRPDKRPVIADIRDSGQIEQHADVIAFLFRPSVYAPDEHPASEAELLVLKNRDGVPGIVPLKWQGRSMSFESVPNEGEDFDPLAAFDGGDVTGSVPRM
jgi:replicative DNA helicase